MDLQSPRAVSAVRRNPPRKAKQTPYNQSITNVSTSCNSGAVAGVTPFDEHLLHSDRVQAVLLPSPKFPRVSDEESNNLKVFLRIRPLDGIRRAAPNRIRCETGGLGRGKVAKDRERENSSCLFVNSSTSVTLNAPPSVLDSKRAKSEVYDGFSCIFPKESLQEDIYDKVMHPLVMAFMEGQSSLLVAMGPTGSGKTYTMFGSHQQLGIVSLALRRIFCNVTENKNIQFSRSYYMSMFEIHSERGKSEKILDLSSASIDLSHQHATINNLTEMLFLFYRRGFQILLTQRNL
ncbi:hypothetical protein HPP92_014120 [Vanilla planifolia]|uniref:Kinesin motor domain-containing protein n=1 Tax=Vanilla planifolia TaxID=51239 RepID=A0A835QQZ5_VANPL|nr:hypothetical protein HPP92_014120 [Vanilla planifolia]